MGNGGKCEAGTKRKVLEGRWKSYGIARENAGSDKGKIGRAGGRGECGVTLYIVTYQGGGGRGAEAELGRRAPSTEGLEETGVVEHFGEGP